MDFEDTVSEMSSSSDVNSATASNKKKDDKDKKAKKPDSQQSGSKFTHSRFSSNVEDLDVDVEGEIDNANPTSAPQNNDYGNGGTGKGRRGLDIDMADVEVNEIKGLGSQGKQLVQLIEQNEKNKQPTLTKNDKRMLNQKGYDDNQITENSHKAKIFNQHIGSIQK